MLNLQRRKSNLAIAPPQSYPCTAEVISALIRTLTAPSTIHCSFVQSRDSALAKVCVPKHKIHWSDLDLQSW